MLNHGITWSSTNGNVVSVSTGGMMSLAGPGSATVAASAGGVSASRTFSVTAPVPGVTWGMSGPGTTNVTQASGSSDVEATYSLNLGGGGVPQQSWDVSGLTASAGTMTLDWGLDGFHAWFAAYAYLDLIVIRGGSVVSTTALVGQGVSGPFGFNGSNSVTVQAGDRVVFRIRGQNFDSDSRLLGTLRVTVR